MKLKLKFEDVVLIIGTLFLIMSLSSCSPTILPDLDKAWVQSIPKGQHYTLNGRRDGMFTDDNKSFGYQFCFKNSYYNHGDEDQNDYNKAIMLKAKRFETHDLTKGNGWKVNEKDSTIQVNFYNHGIIEGSNEYFKIANGAWFTNDSTGYITIPSDGCFNTKYTILDDRTLILHTLENPYNGRKISDLVKLKRPFPEEFMLVNPYFGGNRVSPNRKVFMTFWNTYEGIKVKEKEEKKRRLKKFFTRGK